MQAPCPKACSGPRLEIERDAVDAVAETGRRRTVRKNVAQVSAAAAAVHLGARHAVGLVHGRADGSVERGKEAGPPGTALELAAGGEECLAAAGTAERTRALLLQKRARAGRFGIVAAQHRVLLRRQRAAPFLVCLFNWKCHCLFLFAGSAYARSKTRISPLSIPSIFRCRSSD